MLLSLYRAISAARRVDTAERALIQRGQAFFHVSGTGHEGSAVLARHLIEADYLHCHYRDKALLLAQGVEPVEFFRNLIGTVEGECAGRQMSAHLSDRKRNVLSIVGPVGNQALQAVGVAMEIKDRPSRPIVLCSMGDGSSQQGEVMEAIAEAVRWELPVLFWVEDNGYSISTKTGGKTWFDAIRGAGARRAGASSPRNAGGSGRGRPGSTTEGGPSPQPSPGVPGEGELGINVEEFYGLKLHRMDGWDVLGCDERVGEIIAEMRQTRRPAIVIFRVQRLSDHTNSDDQDVYRSSEEIERAQATADPVAILRKKLLESGVAEEELQKIEREAEEQVRAAMEQALAEPAPTAVMGAKKIESLNHRSIESMNAPSNDSMLRCSDDSIPNDSMIQCSDDSITRLTMSEAIRETLRNRMTSDSRITLYGEDIEDPKGDVFGVTRGLTAAYPGRVRNSPVSESTIVGTAIGRALAGGRPVAFIQFADFLPLAFNQIACELGSMYWRTNGAWECPVIVMAACGGYRPGLGPFHAQTYESALAHVPGVDVCMASNAGDAAGMLNAAFESGRPTIFLYPKARLNDPELSTSADVDKHLVPVGRARKLRSGNEITIVAWGSTVKIAMQTADALAEINCRADVIDLRWISPWDKDAIIASAKQTGRLLVVHEDNQTCGFGAEILASVAEAATGVKQLRRVTRPDTYVPCYFANQLEVLPSFKKVLTAAAEMLDLELSWEKAVETEAGKVIVRAIGSSPADESAMVADIKVKPGDRIAAGDLLACLDCDKALFDLTSPISGVVEAVHVKPGQTIAIGTPMMTVITGDEKSRHSNHEPAETPRLKKRAERIMSQFTPLD